MLPQNWRPHYDNGRPRRRFPPRGDAHSSACGLDRFPGSSRDTRGRRPSNRRWKRHFLQRFCSCATLPCRRPHADGVCERSSLTPPHRTLHRSTCRPLMAGSDTRCLFQSDDKVPTGPSRSLFFFQSLYLHGTTSPRIGAGSLGTASNQGRSKTSGSATGGEGWGGSFLLKIIWTNFIPEVQRQVSITKVKACVCLVGQLNDTSLYCC